MELNAETLPLWLALVIQTGLGFAVLQANPKSYANRCFLIVALIISAWLLSLHLAFNASTGSVAMLWIRNASSIGLMIVPAFNLLRLAIIHREGTARTVVRDCILLTLATAAVATLCYAPGFLQSAIVRPGNTPKAVYGPLLRYYVGYFVVSVAIVVGFYLRDMRRAGGIQKVELQFVIAASATLFALAAIGSALQPLLPRQVLLLFAPFRVVIFTLIIAYGIATTKIMEVGLFVRRAMAYLLLTTYLLVVYAAIWWSVSAFLRETTSAEPGEVAHVIAAIAIAFAVAPARGISRRLAERLLPGGRQLDFRVTMRKATAILQSVSTLDDLLDRFVKTIGEAVNTERIVILLPSRAGFSQRYPLSEGNSRERGLAFHRDDSLVEYLAQHPEPLVLDELRRVRPTPQLERIARQMQHLEIAVVMGIFSREHLAGIMLLGPRLSGRIYGTVEQNALQVLCGQLAVAIDNAQLFTEVQNAKIYNETLLHNMTTGVIAASAEGLITVFNNEAEQITLQRADELLDRPIAFLPGPVRDLMQETLRSGDRQEDRELVLHGDEGNIIARASSSLFHGQEGHVLGALVVLTDITHLKRLEMQIRRSDRLASLGTLSAGMAHEIKNPLVSIKTFAQLLPERYQDSDFRDTFSTLIGHEIDRIDSLVNQLLRFARPAKPLLKPMHVHDVLEKSLMLVAHRLYQKEIKLSRSWNADVDTIRADADQMEQVFLNFFLNAMDAMKQGGELQVATEIRSASEWSPVGTAHAHGDEILRVSVRDNGTGIKTEDIGHVFDPFFTTKDYGTGLGLSVVHGIIQEHGGQIEVESEFAKGTAFHILLPLVRFEEEVAAA